MNELDTLRKRATYNWIYADQPKPHEVGRLAKRYPKLHPVITRLLVAMGLRSEKELHAFFSLNPERIRRAGTLLGQERAARRIIEAIEKGQHIRLYGDYDVDGTTSVAAMSLFLRDRGARFDTYIPDRYEEGYGLGEKGVESALAAHVDLLITLDCGIRAVENIRILADAGVDTIVCDHHEPGAELPPAVAILNPKQAACTYEGKEICGCGVALVLILEISKQMGISPNMDPIYELTGIATCADIVPLTGVNRAIVAEGLRVMSTTPGAGVRALLEASGFKASHVVVSDVVFKIAPRINAAGRMDHARIGVDLLTADNLDAAREIAAKMEKLNRERKEMDKLITQEATEKMVGADPQGRRFSTVVSGKNWHKGLVGIVASRLMEVFYRPTVVLTESKGLLTGSARSVKEFNLHEAFTQCDDLLVRYGGHAAAAGLTLRPEDLPAFEERFEELAENRLKNHTGRPELRISLALKFSEWHNDDYQCFYDQLRRLRPHGPGNLPPVFATAGCLADSVKVVGNDHLKFSAFEPGTANRLPAIAFGQADKYEKILSGEPFEMAYTIDENTWKGRRSLQLLVKDIRF